MLRSYLVALFGFVALDSIWLGLLMKRFYREELGMMARLSPDGSLAPVWAAAIPVYFLLALGVVVFVAPRAAGVSWATAAAYGALFGLITYSIYDLTNLATLKHFSVRLAGVDMAWGSFATAMVTLLVKKFS